MPKYNVMKQFDKLSSFMGMNLRFQNDLEELGKYLFENLQEVKGIYKTTNNRGREDTIDVLKIKGGYEIYSNGAMYKSGENLSDIHNLYWMFETINECLDDASKISSALKKITKVIEKENKD